MLRPLGKMKPRKCVVLNLTEGETIDNKRYTMTSEVDKRSERSSEGRRQQVVCVGGSGQALLWGS